MSVAVKVKAALIDPETLGVVWANEAVEQSLAERGVTFASGMSAAEVMPVADPASVAAALHVAAETGLPQHLGADLVSMTRGSVTVSASIYRLPDGMLLMLSEHGWHAAPRDSGRSGRRP